MYIRFVTPEWVPVARTQRGFFSAAYHAAFHRSTPDWISSQLRQEIGWFESNLDTPRAFGKRTGRESRHGVCWFRDAAAAHVSRARYICWLLSELGQTTKELRSARPGTVVWQDDHQVVALAERRATHKIIY